MKKQEALDLFGGSAALADAIGITQQAIYEWPEVLPPRIADRVIAACVRTNREVPQSLIARESK